MAVYKRFAANEYDKALRLLHWLGRLKCAAEGKRWPRAARLNRRIRRRRGLKATGEKRHGRVVYVLSGPLPADMGDPRIKHPGVAGFLVPMGPWAEAQLGKKVPGTNRTMPATALARTSLTARERAALRRTGHD